MIHWTIDYLRKNYSYVYPGGEKFWFPLYIFQDGSNKVPSHDHDFFEIAIAYCGKAINMHVSLGSGKKKKDAGDIFGISPAERHELMQYGGILSRVSGGRIGAGYARTPLACFEKAVVNV